MSNEPATPKATASPPSEVLEALTEALEPFASLADEMERVGAVHEMAPSSIRRSAKYEHCVAARNARALIAEHDATKGGRDD